MSKVQRWFVVAWLLLLIAMLLIIPYSASYKFSRERIVVADAEYSLVSRRPTGEECIQAIRNHLGTSRTLDATHCMIYPDFKRLAITLIAAALAGLSGVLAFGLASRGRNKLAPRSSLPSTEPAPQATKRPSGLAAELVEKDPSLPISSGDLTEHNPMVITATADYVGVEYAVVELMHAREPSIYFKFKSQALLRVANRSIDVQSYYYKTRGAASWEGVRTYYFDITAGFSTLDRPATEGGLGSGPTATTGSDPRAII